MPLLSDESNGSNSSQSPGLGPDFRCIRFIRCGPGADSAESTESKVLALGPTLDSLDSLDAFDALDAEAPEGRGGGDLDLMSWGHCRFIRSIRFVPASEYNEAHDSKVAPMTFDSDTTTTPPRFRCL